MLKTDYREEILQKAKGNWRHLKKSYAWEQYNENNAKNKIGSFGTEAQYLVWQSDDAREHLFIEVKEYRINDDTLYIKHRSGLEYWFKKETV